ncbi:MAG: hypothetical protein GEU78_20460, partial [Actinobacteria bacterium]|nr:hypothetical protein [Actinomycetota bacterium]
MAWRVARSLLTLRDQVDAAAPNRSKRSDGTIGDAAHASRSSDHNPWVKDGATGVVTAIDLTHDPAGGANMHTISEALRTSGRAQSILDQPSMIGGHLDTVGPIPLGQIGDALKKLTSTALQGPKGDPGPPGAPGMTAAQVAALLNGARIEGSIK